MSRAFPRSPGSKYGPALFPGVIAVALAICASLLIVKGLTARAHRREHVHWVELEPWTRSRRHVLAFALALGVNLFYIVAVDWLGFIPAAIVYLAALLAVFGVRARWILPIAVLSTLVISYGLLQAPARSAALGPVGAYPVVTTRRAGRMR